MIIQPKQKIINTLNEAAPVLETISADFFVIGAAGIVLSGFDIGDTSDIDILTTRDNSDKLQLAWHDKQEINPILKEVNLFRSNFARFKFPLMDVEVMGDLEIKKDNEWIPLIINDYHRIHLDKISLNVPTINEQIRILHLFDRPKDNKRINTLNKLIKG
ncbi:nucleotidyltransferase family protein [Mucilaginibacter segetis]|uniref:Nucleotidyltransferase n=1 Tax=Mucilaginibacter segetis TaxID=2793071 RepID=A0A934PR20_9SPHI|nr:hypothetical protein [Mucilaginibacter segetis]MBK0377877.1 hypothetical protein [Mucilaginibacter segetis]